MSIIKPEGNAVTRSFRLDTAWDKALVKLAEEKGTSVSSLLEIILRDYILFYRWAEELESIIFSPSTIKMLIDSLSEEELLELSRKSAKITFEESYLRRGDSLTLDTVKFQITEQMGKYAHWFKVDEFNESTHYFYIHQELGKKWGIFVQAYITALLENIGKIDVKSEIIGENIIININKER